MDAANPNRPVDGVNRAAVVQTCRVLLRPIASLLLKCGMTWREFAEVSKGVFIAAASNDYGLNGRPTNVSRVSILTGVSRKEVARVRALLDAQTPPLPNKTTDATRLLSGWHQDPDFVTSAGEPRVLPAEGSRSSFASLWTRYGGDVPLTSMRKELERAGAVTVLPDGSLRAERRYFMPVSFDPQWILNAGSMLRDLGSSISHNLDAGSGSPDDPTMVRRFIGRATSDNVEVSAIPEFQAFVEARGQQFLETVDTWLTAHEARQAAIAAADSRPGGPRKRVRLGLGVFLIQED